MNIITYMVGKKTTSTFSLIVSWGRACHHATGGGRLASCRLLMEVEHFQVSQKLHWFTKCLYCQHALGCLQVRSESDMCNVTLLRISTWWIQCQLQATLMIAHGIYMQCGCLVKCSIILVEAYQQYVYDELSRCSKRSQKKQSPTIHRQISIHLITPAKESIQDNFQPLYLE